MVPISQFDTLIDNLSVEEMLLYTAELKRLPSESREVKQEVVSDGALLLYRGW